MKQIAKDMIILVLCYIPGSIGIRLRRFFYRYILGSIGENVSIGVGVRFTSPDLIHIGNDVWVDDYALLIAGHAAIGNRYLYRKDSLSDAASEGMIRIGNRVHVASFTLIQGHGGVLIGDDCTIGSGTKIYTLSHHYRTMGNTPVGGLVCKYSSMAPQEEQSMILGPVVIENSTAILPNCILLAGAHLSEGSWLMAGSQLLEIIPPFKMAGGSPAKVLKDRSIG